MKELFGKPMFPILGVILLLIVYFSLDQAVIHCGLGASCSAINANNAFGAPIVRAEKDFGALKSKMDEKDAEIEQLKLKPVIDPEKEKKEYDKRLVDLKTESNNIRQEIAARYSNRMSWTFLTAVFLLLAFSAIVLAIVIIKDSVVATMRWIITTSVIAVLFAVVMFVSLGYMRVLRGLYANTVFGGYDLPFPLLNFSNVLGFAATIFLVAAVSAILFSVEEKHVEEQTVADLTARRNTTGDLDENAAQEAKTASVTLAEKYEKQMDNLKFVLYLGGAMLFVAVLQLNTLAEWHRAFLPPEISTTVSSIHQTFFKSSITFQAGIYTILLGIIYLPAAYIIKQKAVALNRLRALPDEDLEKMGLTFSFWDYLPKLLTILSPFLATSGIKLIEYITNAKG